jgi:chorismate synthase
MASNSFGTLFRITTWGESHGKAIGVVIDGCPAGIEIDNFSISEELNSRAPGKSVYTSPRIEPDQPEILSGVFEGKTTGAPISILIYNKNADSTKYAPIKDLLRPGHANYTFLEKYGIFDYRGGGRASARETACRVAAGAIAKKFLKHYNIDVLAYIKQIGEIDAIIAPSDTPLLRSQISNSPINCPDPKATQLISALIEKTKSEGDSVGGLVEFFIPSLPVGLGDPVYEKIEAKLASAMLSIPASKGFEIGSGLKSVAMFGSSHNDAFICKNGEVRTETNHAGGTLGGITTGMPVIGRVAFKPASSIKLPQKTLTLNKEEKTFQLPEGSKHDPCVAIRAVPVVEAMVALVLADSILLNRSSKL